MTDGGVSDLGSDALGSAPIRHIIGGSRGFGLTPTDAHGLGRRPTRADRAPIDPELLAEFNRGTQRAIRANHDREARERHLDSLYFWREVTG